MDAEHKAVTDQLRNAAGEDDLMGVIADVERQLSGLRQFKAEREEERQRLTQKEQTLAAQERQLTEKAHEISTREAAVQARAEKLDTDFRTLTEEQQRAASSAEKREADLTARTATIDEREHRLSENAATMSRERQGLDTRAAELTEKESKLRAAAVEIDRERTRCAQAEQAAAELAQQARAEAKAAAEKAREAERHAESARAELQNAAQARDALADELRARSHALEQTSARAAAAQEENKSLQATLAERETRVQELNAKLQNATGKFREVCERLKEQAELIGQANGMAAALKAKDDRIAELEARPAAAPENADAARQIAALQEQAKAALNRVREQEKQIAEIEARASKGGAKEGKQAAALNRRVEELTADLAKARRQIEAFRAKPESAGAGVPAEIGEAIMTRWRRLRLMRELLQDQGTKLRQAGDALRGRYEQAEQLLNQREELVAARAAIGESRKKLERMMARASKNKAVAAIFHAVGILAALGGIAWAIAGEVAPATILAKATIAADNRATSVSDDQLAEWRKYHEGLLTDPSLIEVAADRMGRRGLETLANPGLLSQRLTTDLNHESSVPGQLTVELRGQGRDRTVRTLDTFVNALVSQSNASKERRADGLATIIAEAPNTMGGVLSDQRPIYALGIFGIGFGLTAMAGLLIWRRLAAVKVRFEEEAKIDDILDNANWAKPPEAFAKN